MSDSDEQEPNGLSPQSTLEEVFKYIETGEGGVQVLPVTVSKQTDARAQLMIIIQGQNAMAHSILANLMMQVANMHEDAERAHAAVDPEDDGQPTPKPLKLVEVEGSSDGKPRAKLVS